MKNWVVLIGFCIGLLSCSKEDQNTADNIEGKWSLTRQLVFNKLGVAKEFIFEDNQVIYFFKPNNQLIVKDSTGQERLFSYRIYGENLLYPNNPDGPETQLIDIDNRQNLITVKGLKLIIDGSCFNEPIYYFERK